MICPACRTPLRIIEAAALEIDQCPACYGIWFDRSELRPFIEFVLEQRDDVENADYGSRGLQNPESSSAEPVLSCPVCAVQLDKFNYAVDSNVILDRCSDCEGVWVEKPEIRELARFLKGSPAHDRLGKQRAQLANDTERVRDVAESVKAIARVLSFRPRGKWS